MRDCMDRRVTLPKRVTSLTWGPPPPCKQALSAYLPSQNEYPSSRNFHSYHCVSTECVPDYGLLGEFEAKILTVLLPLFSRLFRLLSSRILQNNLLDLYLVEIRR